MRTKALLLLCLFLVIGASVASGQEWTKAQKEVWQIVEDGWMKWKTGDFDGYTAILHEKYQGWSDDDPLPYSKEMAKDWYQVMKNRIKIDMYQINPAIITVTSNAAVVDYYFYYEETYTRGDAKKLEDWYGKSTEFYVKEGDKWLLLGDFSVYKKVPEDK